MTPESGLVMFSYEDECQVRKLWLTMDDFDRREVLTRAGYPEVRFYSSASLELCNLPNDVLDRVIEYYGECRFNPCFHKEY